MTALDSSVCIAALLEWHDNHQSCAEASHEASIPALALLLIAGVAIERGEIIATCDQRAAKTYAALGADVTFVS